MKNSRITFAKWKSELKGSIARGTK